MITSTIRINQGFMAKTIAFGAICLLFMTSFSCSAYKQVSIAKSEFMSNKQIQSSLQDYSLYLHDGSATYLMNRVAVVDGKNLSADLEATTYEAPKEDWKRHERKAWWKAHKYDIHIYTNENANSTASVDGAIALLYDHVVLADEMIRDIKVMALDKEKSISTALVVVVAVAGVALAVLMGVLIANASDSGGSGASDSNSGTSDSGDSGGSNSGGSDSGGSDSGGSDSGGSDSGGSDSDSNS